MQCSFTQEISAVIKWESHVCSLLQPPGTRHQVVSGLQYELCVYLSSYLWRYQPAAPGASNLHLFRSCELWFHIHRYRQERIGIQFHLILHLQQQSWEIRFLIPAGCVLWLRAPQSGDLIWSCWFVCGEAFTPGGNMLPTAPYLSPVSYDPNSVVFQEANSAHEEDFWSVL